MGPSPSAVDAWENARVFDAWNILIGERMAKSCGTPSRNFTAGALTWDAKDRCDPESKAQDPKPHVTLIGK